MNVGQLLRVIEKLRAHGLIDDTLVTLQVFQPDGTEYPINGVKVEVGSMQWDDGGTEQFTPSPRPIRKITLTP